MVFFYVLKLENAPSLRPAPKEVTGEATILSQRRLKEKETESEARHQNVKDIERKKASGPKLVLQCIAVNLTFTVALYFVIIPGFQLLCDFVDTELVGTAEWCLFYVRKVILVVANIVCCLFYIPLYLFMKVFNGIWCLDVSNAALCYTKVHSMKSFSFAYSVGDTLVALLVQLLFMIQIWLVTFIDYRVPFVGQMICFVHLSLLYSLFSYEYVWMARGKTVADRLDLIERNWPYYLGFGAIMAATGMIWTGFILSYLVFGMCFPFFIISAYVTDEVKRPPIRTSIPPLHMFSPCLLVANYISNMVANAVDHCFTTDV